MSEGKHTPTPWHVERDGSIHGPYLHPSFGFQASWPLAHVECRGIEENAANAEFIVRACNSHCDLLGALRRLAKETQGFLSMANCEQHGNTNIAVMQWVISEALDAISKAEATE